MRIPLSFALAGLLFFGGVSSKAQTRALPLVVPVARGPVISALNRQLAPLTAALSGSAHSPTLGLTEAFQAQVAPAPAGAATPAAFAARSALISALAAPKTELPALVAALRESGGRKAEKAAAALEQIGRALKAAKPMERRALAAAAAALSARFDGASAAPGEVVDLSLVLTNDKKGPSTKLADIKRKREIKTLYALENVLAAAKTQAVLVVIQGMDAAGKDGVIKYGMTGLNPAFVRVASFKKPTAEEAAQDFLERIKKEVPKPGIIGVFNRSHYEDLIVPIAFGTHDTAIIESRYARINEFELGLARRGVRVVKVFLHMSKDVQRERLQNRIDDPRKNWKISPSDLEMRKYWDELQKAFGSVLARTSTWHAPWNVIAADHAPRRNLAFAKLLRKTLQRMGLEYPQAHDLKGVKIPK